MPGLWGNLGAEAVCFHTPICNSKYVSCIQVVEIIQTHSQPSGRWVGLNLVFCCTLLGGQPHPTDEARQVAWLSMDEAKRDMPEARLVRVTDALTTNDNGGPPVRIHDGTRLI